MIEKTISSKIHFTGKIFQVEVQQIELEPGTRATREIVRHAPAVAVMAHLAGKGFVLVRQYRKPVEAEVLEIVAGLVEPGEALEDCARREVREETGYDVRSMVELGEMWPSAGYCDERLHMYFAEVEDNGRGQQPDEDERVVPVILTVEQLRQTIAAGEIRDAKTMAAWCLWNERIRGK